MKGTIAVLSFVLFTAACVDEPQPVPPPPVPTPEMCPTGFGPLVTPVGELAGCSREGPAAAWITAEEACESNAALDRAAHLIIIDREEEHLAIASLSVTRDIWIGRLQKDDDDAYRNINYIDWRPTYFGAGEPNDYGASCVGCTEHSGGGDERCIEYKHETMLWNDEKCYRADRVICEWDNVEPYNWRPGD